MFTLAKSPQPQYGHLPESETSSDSDLLMGKRGHSPSSRQSWWKIFKIAALVCTATITVVAVFGLGYASGSRSYSRTESSPQNHTVQEVTANACKDPYMRKEWRSLSKEEKQDYLDAFQCFIDKPSMLGMNGSLYNDFSFVHNLIAHSTHGKAPFLSWHRRFIFVYEKTLRSACGYKGAVPFWDWSLDWEDLPKSSIFDSKLGFGGNGDPKAEKHLTAHCVTDSPFKNLTPQWYGSKYEPHCLSRAFTTDDWYGHYLSPDALGKVLNTTTYEEFYLALEMTAHDIIPTGVNGDFMAFTAPNDPIFYLHHSQLDRLWWLWQQRDLKNRLHDYNGEGDNNRNVTLDDTLPLAGLDEDITVLGIMGTESGGMCYRYMYY